MNQDKKELTKAKRCAHCGNLAPMEVAGRHTQTDSYYDSDEEHSWSWVVSTTHSLLICQACGRPVLEVTTYDDRDDPDEAPWTKTLYPQPDTMGIVLPRAVRTEYEAAAKVKSISGNAYAVLLGRVFEKVCQDRKASGTSLSEKLADLASKGEIPQTLVKMAHGLRQLRNVGAHADLGDLTSQEIQLLEAIVRAILEYVYRAPRLVQEVTNILAKRKGSKP